MPSAVTLYRAPNLPSQNCATNTNTNMVLDARGNVLSLPFPTNGSLNGIPWTIRVAGHCGTKANGNLTVTCYVGSSSTVANNTLFGTTGAKSTSTTQPQFIWEIKGCVNTGTGIAGTGELEGYHMGIMGAATITQAACAGIVGFDPNQDLNNQSSPPLSFSLSTLFNVFSAGDQYFIDVFELQV